MDPRQRAARLKLMAFDIDGVMTDGGLTYTDDGQERKTFNVQDGFGIKMLQKAGLEVAIITGRNSGVVAARAADLGIEHVAQGVGDKYAALALVLEKLGLHWHETGFMGDDLIDLPAMLHCGLAIAPANAHPLVKERAHAITDQSGGKGAVREAVEFILDAQGKLAPLVATYLEAR